MMKEILNVFAMLIGGIGFLSCPLLATEANDSDSVITEEDNEDFDDTFSLQGGMGSLVNLAKDMQEFTNNV